MLAPRRVALLLALAVGTAVCAGQATTRFDGERALTHLRQLVVLGPRPAGSAAIGKARAYLTRQLRQIGVEVREQAFEARTPLGPTAMANLVATIAGEHPDRIVFAGHYDTKRFDEIAFVGANDGGSSAAFLVELARVLAARRNPLTIQLLFLDGEEAVIEWIGDDHTYGSRHYVEAARADGSLAGLRTLVLVDMIGDRDLAMHREGNSTPWLTDIIWASARRLGHARHFLDSTTFIEDDHVPFLQAGVPAVDLIDLEYPPWHTQGDTVDKVSSASLQVVGDVLLDALPEIEKRVSAPR